MTTLVLCRHAEEGNAEQARALAEELADLRLAAVYTSPLGRAVETARAVASPHELSPLVVSELREIEFGDVEGLSFDEFPTGLQQGLLQAPAEVRFPGGETYTELQHRVCAALDRIVGAHPDRAIVAVSHAGSIRAALAQWLRMDDHAIFRIDQRHASVNVVDWFDGVPLVRLMNGARLNG
jgi:broad specificity phosphatase PhoE